MRVKLKECISKLVPSETWCLQAKHVSEDATPSDIENILFYNLQAEGSFEHLNLDRVYFERQYTCPSNKTSQLAHRPAYYYQYKLTNQFDQSYWIKDKVLVCWNGVPWCSLKGDRGAHDHWYRLKKAGVSCSDGYVIPTYFGINLVISKPADAKINIISKLKSLLDGIISAFHSQDYVRPSVIRSLSSKLGVGSDELQALLSERTYAVLGDAEVIQPGSGGIQWCPADHNCVCAEIAMEDNRSDNSWHIAGEIFTVIHECVA